MARELLKGYSRVPGSARRYLTPSGVEISRREYDNRVLAREARAGRSPFKTRAEKERAAINTQGFRSTYQAQQFRKSQDWKVWQGRIAEKTGKRLTARSPEFAAAHQVADARAGLPDHKRPDGSTYTLDHDDDRLVDSDGPLADLLVALGYRDPDWEWAVGDTPAGASTK